ncbi:hypothetical protein AKO1_009023 [Acrasis kona]|uniref:Histidine kinase n=1 Tax=Acrasis kona TaxID=1008807 RepID=A0AAW2ZIG9_9EUKA
MKSGTRVYNNHDQPLADCKSRQDLLNEVVTDTTNYYAPFVILTCSVCAFSSDDPKKFIYSVIFTYSITTIIMIMYKKYLHLLPSKIQVAFTILRTIMINLATINLQVTAGVNAPGYLLYIFSLWVGTLSLARFSDNPLVLVSGISIRVVTNFVTMYLMEHDSKDLVISTFLLITIGSMTLFFKSFVTRLLALEKREIQATETRRMMGLYQKLYHNAPVMFLSLDAKELRVVNYNRRGNEVLGGEVVDKHMSFTDLFATEDRDRVSDLLSRAKRSEDGTLHSVYAENDFLKLKSRGQETLHVSMCVSSFEDESSGEEMLHVILNDMSHTYQAQENISLLNHKLLEAKNAAERSSLDKSRFLAITSHELRTPLHGIISSCDLVMHTLLDEEQTKIVNVIASCSQLLVDLICKIMDFSKIEANALVLENVSFDLRKCINTACCGLSSKAKENNVIFNVNVEEDVPHYVCGDNVRLSQVLVNLVGNALKFTNSKGHVDVLVDCRPSYTPSFHTIRFIVKDTGIGISNESVSALFRDFSQVDTSTTRRFGGTGLGLAISKRIACLMNGDITVDSKLGVGSTFTFECLLGFSPPIPIAPDTPQSPITPIYTPQDYFSPPTRECYSICDFSFSKLRVLVAEDNAINQIVMTKMLNKLGVTNVTIVENGLEAVNCFKSNTFDLVLMDGSMPIMDGYQSCKSIRKYEKEMSLRKVPVIAVTANATDRLGELCIEAGMSSYLTKPVVSSALQTAILNTFN